jgi:predicted nucleic acid-binding protein
LNIYIDTSAILSIIFEEDNRKQTIKIWKKYQNKYSSNITEAECFNNLQKYRRLMNSPKKDEWYLQKIKILEGLLEEINIRSFNRSITDILKTNENLSHAKTLDSIHLATALYFSYHLDQEIRIFSYDKNMNRVAMKLGLTPLVSEEESF